MLVRSIISVKFRKHSYWMWCRALQYRRTQSGQLRLHCLMHFWKRVWLSRETHATIIAVDALTKASVPFPKWVLLVVYYWPFYA